MDSPRTSRHDQLSKIEKVLRQLNKDQIPILNKVLKADQKNWKRFDLQNN